MSVIIKLNNAGFGNAESNLQSLHSIFMRTGTSLLIFTLSIYVCAHFFFQNCAYYWGFSAWLAYYINHPLYTPPCKSVRVCHIQHVFAFSPAFSSYQSQTVFLHSIRRTASQLCINSICGTYTNNYIGISQIQTPGLFISALDVWNGQLLHSLDSE